MAFYLPENPPQPDCGCDTQPPLSESFPAYSEEYLNFGDPDVHCISFPFIGSGVSEPFTSPHSFESSSVGFFNNQNYATEPHPPLFDFEPIEAISTDLVEPYQENLINTSLPANAPDGPLESTQANAAIAHDVSSLTKCHYCNKAFSKRCDLR